MLNEIDLSRLDLNLLVLFQAVLEEQHVGKAAARLHLSPSAVSHGLGRLRQMLNDPVFLRTPKGVVPTTRAIELMEPVAEILARIGKVVSTAQPFDAAKSTRHFTIGAADGISSVFLTPLLAELRRTAPGIDVSIRQLLPARGIRTNANAWDSAFADLDARAMDIAVAPIAGAPARFAARALYEEDFVVAARAGNPYAKKPTLERFCKMRHIVVSLTGDRHGFVDDVLAKHGLSRRVAVTVPNFLLALSLIAETDMIAALPRTFVAMHAQRFGVKHTEVPFSLPRFKIHALAPKVAMMDAGLAWLFDVLGRSPRGGSRARYGA